MENNIKNFVDTIKIAKSDDNITSYDLFEIVKNNEKLLKRLCDAAMSTYDDLEHIRKILKQ